MSLSPQQIDVGPNGIEREAMTPLQDLDGEVFLVTTGSVMFLVD
jgi:hypothetical protein